jgi:hypothetical protein
MIRTDPASGLTTVIPTPIVPLAITEGPEGNFWLAGRTSSDQNAVSLVAPTGSGLKTVLLPGQGDNGLQAASDAHGGVWVAVSGWAAHISRNGTKTLYRLHHGSCESPWAITSAPDGTGWLVSDWPSAAQCGSVPRFPLQLSRLSDGRMSTVPLSRSFGYFVVSPGLAAFVRGHMWLVGSDPRSLRTALYVVDASEGLARRRRRHKR